MTDISSAPLDNSDAATPAATREFMTKLSGRGYAQYRHILVQLPDKDEPRASTLARMVTGRRHRELILYMLLVSSWGWLETNREPLAADVWIRALTAPGGLTWSGSTLSRSWKHLEELGLLEKRERDDRLVRVTPRREDGTDSYTLPAGRTDRQNTYFTLPDAFWNDELFAKLSMPGLAVLLVVAKETSNQSEVWFTYDRMDEWYGLKARTVQTGVKELRTLGLLDIREEVVTAPLSPTGKTVRIFYSLVAPYSYEARAAMQAKAQKETRARARKSSTKVAMKPTRPSRKATK